MNKIVILYYNGLLFMQIYSKGSLDLFNIEGYLIFDMILKNGNYFVFVLDKCVYRNIISGKVMIFFNNLLINIMV